MKSILNIPKIKHDTFNNNNRFKRFAEPSVILCTSDKYFGEGYELYEHSYRYLITKDLGQCYKLHAIYLNKFPEFMYENAHDYYRG